MSRVRAVQRPTSSQGKVQKPPRSASAPPRLNEDLAARIVMMKWTPPQRLLTMEPLSSVSAAKAGRAVVHCSRRVRRTPQVCIPGDSVGEGLARGARGRSGAASAGEGESPLGGVEVRAIREGEQGLVAEGGGDGAVKQVRHVSPFAGFL